MSRLNQMHPELVPVPIPDRIAAMIGSRIPADVLQAEFDAVAAEREALRFRPLASNEDRADLEQALALLARHNKVLAKHHPLMPIRPNGVAA
ncbi:MAG TPA: hypothetical protein VIP77_11645 [Jiangellaceae bacterium]